MSARDPESIPALRPLDEANRRLLENVHPPGWTNPCPAARYHLVVVGAGTGGLVTAAIAAGLGARVALVERGLMGGDCLNTGCVPSKALLAAARGWQAAREAAERFGGPAVAGEGSFAAAMERMRRIRADIAPVDGARRFAELGVDVFLGHGHFVSDEAVEVEGARLRFHRAVIATGGRAALPPVPGLAEAGCLTHETVFSLTELPERLAVLGGGPIGCELAQAFARFGSRVTLLEAAERILPRDDPDASAVLAAALAREGVEVLAGAGVTAVEEGGAGKRIRYRRAGGEGVVEASELLVAAGRRPEVEGLGLDVAGIEHDAGCLAVDARLRTSSPRVYAVGDVASPLHLTHVADAQARLVVRNALFFGRGRWDARAVPWCTYTSPEVAHVGPPAEALRARGAEVETITVPLEEVDRARLEGRTEGFVRVHLKRGSDTLLGATIVAEHAGDLVAQVAQAMTAGVGLGKVGETVFPYPTVAEGLRRAADRWRRGKLTPLARGAFSAFFRVVGR
jgi:pyruvate/2-oxoglutarate dehydrogenase complex dihydrolipoamide dehydrogenase (E3) component